MKGTAKQALGYGLGAVGKDMVYALVSGFILYYYNDILGISGTFTGVMMMAARVFDAFNDPLMGVVVALAAVTQVSRTRGVDVASAGLGYELDAIAAVVVGGTSMSGGRGHILGTVLGVLIIGVMNNLLILLGADSFLTDAFKGAIVIAAVLLQRKQQQ